MGGLTLSCRRGRGGLENTRRERWVASRSPAGGEGGGLENTRRERGTAKHFELLVGIAIDRFESVQSGVKMKINFYKF